MYINIDICLYLLFAVLSFFFFSFFPLAGKGERNRGFRGYKIVVKMTNVRYVMINGV